MFTQEQINEAVFIHVLHNQEQLKALVKPFTDQKEALLAGEKSVFRDEILKQYEDLVRYEIQLDIAKSLGLPPDQIKSVVEDIDLEELLK
jgi:hypothetical protein